MEECKHEKFLLPLELYNVSFPRAAEIIPADKYLNSILTRGWEKQNVQTLPRELKLEPDERMGLFGRGPEAFDFGVPQIWYVIFGKLKLLIYFDSVLIIINIFFIF